jgi:hypothetical protein
MIHKNVINKKNMKAQITMFVILGLVLFILAIMFFSFIKQFKPKPNTVSKIIDELETGRLKEHVTSCMTEVGAEGLEKLGANGGVIYDFEGGRIPFNNSALGVEYLNYTFMDNLYLVAYGLKKNTNCSLIDYSIEGYPYPGVSIDQLNPFYNDLQTGCVYNTPQSGYDGFFGQNVMNKLCYLARQSGCESFANGPIMGFTLQKQLEDYISAKLPLCIDFDAFTQRMDADITVNATPVVETNIHDGEILLVTKYPITISFENQEPVTQIITYQTTLNVRLSRVYNFLHNNFVMESKIPGFDINTSYTTSLYWREGIELQRIKAPCTSCPLPALYDDVVEVIDRESSVNGKPFIFRTAIENRRPALDLISDQVVDVNTFSAGETLDLPLNAYDPDDSPITYYFLSFGYGKEDFDRGRYGNFPGRGFPDPNQACMASDFGGWAARAVNIQSSVLQLPLINKYDYGVHPVGILAVDETGLFDLQKFNITVNYPISTPAPGGCVGNCMNTFGSMGFWCAPARFNSLADYLQAYCEEWCSVAANPCADECVLTDDNPFSFDRTDDSCPNCCMDCVMPIVHSQQPSRHNCEPIYAPTKESCIAKMPNCFWISQKNPVTDEFFEGCYDVNDLSSLFTPAYIITI